MATTGPDPTYVVTTWRVKGSNSTAKTGGRHSTGNLFMRLGATGMFGNMRTVRDYASIRFLIVITLALTCCC